MYMENYNYGLKDFDEKLKWWKSLKSKEKQQWLLVFVNNLTFEENNKDLSDNWFESALDYEPEPYKNEIPCPIIENTIYPPELKRSQYMDRSTMEFINSQLENCKNYMSDSQELMNSINEVDSEYWEKYGHLVSKYNQKFS